jgi:DNA primase
MPGFFSTSTLEQIRAASDIVDVIGSYLPLKRAGANFVALCPFHKEKTPSFNVNPHRQIFHCFGCHKGGDVFAFVKEYESLDFPEAVRRLAERAKIPLEYEQGAGEQQARHLKERLLQIHEQITLRWQGALANEAGGQIARDYLARRGVSAEAVKLFRLGYAPDLWDDTVNWARSKGHEPALVEQAGLILRKEGGSAHYDRFRGRLMFPICDEQGRVIGFSGRILAGDEKTAKYVNSPETPIFTKSKVFFGLDKSKRALLDAGGAIVCEGQLDLIACFMAGVQNIVAPQGTAFTADHARILKRYVEEVVLCFDSDEAGQNAAVRSLDSLLASGLAVRVAVVPTPHDPDSFIKASGGAAFKQLIERAEGFFDFYLNRLCATNAVTTDKGRLAVLHAMSEAIHKTANLVLIDKYAQKTAFRLGVSPDAVRAEFRKLSRAVRSPVREDRTGAFADTAAPPPPAPVPPLERWLLRVLLTSDDLVGWITERLDGRWVRHPVARLIIEARLSAFRDHSWAGVAPFLNSFQDEEARGLITEVVSDRRPIPDPERTLKGDPVHADKRGILERLRDEHLTGQINQLTSHLVAREAGTPEQVETYQKIAALKALKRQPVALLSAAP